MEVAEAEEAGSGDSPAPGMTLAVGRDFPAAFITLSFGFIVPGSNKGQS